MSKKYRFYVNHPAGREYFSDSELKQANKFAQSLAIELGKPITRFDVRGGEAIIYPPVKAQ